MACFSYIVFADGRRRGKEETETREKQSSCSTMPKQKEGTDRLPSKGKSVTRLCMLTCRGSSGWQLRRKKWKLWIYMMALNPSGSLAKMVDSTLFTSVQESERLEMVNSELKAQIEELRQERQQLMVMLNLHRPTCIVRTDSVKTPESEANPLLEQLSSDAK